MVDRLLRDNFFLRLPGVLWQRFLQAARESFFVRLVLNSRVLLWLRRDLALTCGVMIGLLFVVPHNRFNNLYSLVVLIAAAGLVFLGVLEGRVQSITPPRMGVYGTLFWLMAALAAVATLAVSLRFLLFYVTAFLALIITRSLLTDRRSLTHFIAALLGSVTLGGLYGAWQSVTGVKIVDSQVDMSLNINMPGRIYAFFENPNNFAEILVLTLPLFAALVFAARTPWGRRFAFLAALAPALALLLTFSRSGWMAFGLSVVIFFYFTYRWMVPVLFVAALAALPFLPASIRDRLLSTFAGTDSSILYRSAIRGTLQPILANHWGIGMGLGVDAVREQIMFFYDTRPEFKILTWQIAPHAHNLYLQLWAELGIAGAAAFCGMIISFLRKGVSALFFARKKNFIAAAGIAGIVGALVIGFVEYIWFYPRVQLMFWVVFGITLAALKLGANDPEDA